jgi:hypothetical protein
MRATVMALSPRRNVAADVRRLLEKRLPCSYCDACIAFDFELSLEEARALALTLADSPGFTREHSKCDGCGRPIDVTSVGSKRRRP